MIKLQHLVCDFVERSYMMRAWANNEVKELVITRNKTIIITLIPYLNDPYNLRKRVREAQLYYLVYANMFGFDIKCIHYNYFAM